MSNLNKQKKDRKMQRVRYEIAMQGKSTENMHTYRPCPSFRMAFVGRGGLGQESILEKRLENTSIKSIRREKKRFFCLF